MRSGPTSIAQLIQTLNLDQIALYLRMSVRSSDDDPDDDEGNERQRDTAHELLRDHGLTDVTGVREYPDVESGYNQRKKRPHFDRMLVDIKAGRIRLLVARSYRRLTRNHYDAVPLLEALKAHDVKVLFTDEESPDLTSPDGEDDWWREIEKGRAESASQSKRRRRANAARRGRGQPKVGQRMFGYRWTGSAKRYTLVPDPVEGPAVTEVFRRIKDGTSMFSTAAWLNEQGLSGARGGRWNSASLGYLLKNPVYAARLRHHGEIVEPVNGAVATWPALVEPDQFDEVQAILASHRGAGQRGRPARHLLGNLVHTPEGEPMVVQPNNGRFTLRTKSGKGPVRNAAAVEKFVLPRVIERLNRIDLTEFITTDRGLLKELTQTRRDILARRAEVEDGLAAGTLSVALAGATDQKIQRDLNAVEARLTEVRSQNTGAVVLQKYADSPGQAKAIWEASALDERRAVIRLLFDITAGYRVTNPDDGFVQIEDARDAR